MITTHRKQIHTFTSERNKLREARNERLISSCGVVANERKHMMQLSQHTSTDDLDVFVDNDDTKQKVVEKEQKFYTSQVHKMKILCGCILSVACLILSSRCGGRLTIVHPWDPQPASQDLIGGIGDCQANLLESPEYLKVSGNLASLLQTGAFTDEAHPCLLTTDLLFRLVNLLHPIDAETSSQLARKLFELGERELAKEWWYEAARAGAHEYETNIGVSIIASNASGYLTALPHFERALNNTLGRHTNKQADVQTNLGVAVSHPLAPAAMIDYDKAIFLFERALSIYKKDEEVTEVEVVILHNLAVGNLLCGNNEIAMEHLQQAEIILKHLLGTMPSVEDNSGSSRASNCKWCQPALNENLQLRAAASRRLLSHQADSIHVDDLTIGVIEGSGSCKVKGGGKAGKGQDRLKHNNACIKGMNREDPPIGEDFWQLEQLARQTLKLILI